MSGTVKLEGGVTLDGPRGRVYGSILETIGSTPWCGRRSLPRLRA